MAALLACLHNNPLPRSRALAGAPLLEALGLGQETWSSDRAGTNCRALLEKLSPSQAQAALTLVLKTAPKTLGGCVLLYLT